MSSHPSSEEIHDRAWELLPWLVNGRLERDDGDWLMRHVEACEECRHELGLQTEVQANLAADARVEYAPQASYQKLRSRIDELERTESGPAAGEFARAAVAQAPRFPRWLMGTLATQAALMIALTALIGWQTFDRFLAPRYQTLTSAGQGEAVHGNLRIVLAPSVTVAEFQSLLAAVGAKVVAGPTPANVWTLALPYVAHSPKFDATLRLLRSDERVVFAEPMAMAPAAQ